MLVLICSDELEELKDGGSLDDVDQAVDNAAEDDLENISITCSENISRFNFLNRKFLHSCFRVT